MSVADNLQNIRDRIARAAESAGRLSTEICLVAVTKYVGTTEIEALIDAGCCDMGESRPQQLWTKAATIGTLPQGGAVRWHLIGHLQRNKLRRTLPIVSLIHSVDSQRLLAAIDTEIGQASNLAELGKPPRARVLLEVNTSGEAAKHGFAPDDVEPLLVASVDFPHVEICGLMTMAAREGGPEVAARNFATLRQLRDRLRSVAPESVRLDELSMGMSGDFEVAIREGATIVRVGSSLWENV